MQHLKITKKITNRDSIALNKYLSEISQYELISTDKEIELSERIKKNDIEALNELVKANLRFVVSVAKQYQNQGLMLSDLINDGNIGLIKAAQRFDASKGFKFISYAVWWIRQSILQSLAEYSRIVRLPANKIGSINKINKVFGELLQKYNREPTFEEIAKELNIAPKDIQKVMRNSERHMSMDAPLYDDNERNMYQILANKNTLSPETKLLKESLLKEMKDVLSSLPDRESEIIKMTFGIDMQHPYTYAEIGRKFNISSERVKQIKFQTLKKLRLRSDNLKKYL